MLGKLEINVFISIITQDESRSFFVYKKRQGEYAIGDLKSRNALLLI